MRLQGTPDADNGSAKQRSRLKLPVTLVKLISLPVLSSIQYKLIEESAIDGDNMSVASRVSEHYRSGDPSRLTPMEIALSRCSWCPSVAEDEPEQLEDDPTAASWIDEPRCSVDEAINVNSSGFEAIHQPLDSSFEETAVSPIG